MGPLRELAIRVLLDFSFLAECRPVAYTASADFAATVRFAVIIDPALLSALGLTLLRFPASTIISACRACPAVAHARVFSAVFPTRLLFGRTGRTADRAADRAADRTAAPRIGGTRPRMVPWKTATTRLPWTKFTMIDGYRAVAHILKFADDNVHKHGKQCTDLIDLHGSRISFSCSLVLFFFLFAQFIYG